MSRSPLLERVGAPLLILSLVLGFAAQVGHHLAHGHHHEHGHDHDHRDGPALTSLEVCAGCLAATEAKVADDFATPDLPPSAIAATPNGHAQAAPTVSPRRAFPIRGPPSFS